MDKGIHTDVIHSAGFSTNSTINNSLLTPVQWEPKYTELTHR